MDGVTITIDWDQLGNNSTTDIFNNGAGSWSSFSTDFEDVELLPELKLFTTGSGGYFGSDTGAIIQGHVYSHSKYYQGWRDKQMSKNIDDLQEMFDYVGTIPALGEPVDLINAGISAIRGNYAQAGLGLAAMIPVAGWGATALKLQSHHIIPRAVYTQFGSDIAHLMELGGKNLMNLPVPFHSGSHPAYSNFVISKIDDLKNAGNLTEGSLKALQGDLKSMLNNALDNFHDGTTATNINQYFLKL